MMGHGPRTGYSRSHWILPLKTCWHFPTMPYSNYARFTRLFFLLVNAANLILTSRLWCFSQYQMFEAQKVEYKCVCSPIWNQRLTCDWLDTSYSWLVIGQNTAYHWLVIGRNTSYPDLWLIRILPIPDLWLVRILSTMTCDWSEYFLPLTCDWSEYFLPPEPLGTMYFDCKTSFQFCRWSPKLMSKKAASEKAGEKGGEIEGRGQYYISDCFSNLTYLQMIP